MIIMLPTYYLTILRFYSRNIYSMQAIVFAMTCFIGSYKYWLCRQNWEYIPSLVSTNSVERFVILRPIVRPLVAIVHCGKRTQHLVSHIDVIYAQRSPQLLWPNATIFKKSERGYFCGLWLQWTVTVFSHEYPLCDLSNVVAFSYKKLCSSLAVKLYFNKSNKENLVKVGSQARQCFTRKC